MTEIKEAAKKHVTDQVYEEWFETLSPAQDKALLNLFHKTYEAGANFMIEELLKEPDTILGLSSRIVKLQRQIAKLTEALISTRAFLEIAPLTSGVCHCGDSMDKHTNPMDSGHIPVDMADSAIASAISDINKALKSCEQYDEQTLENL